MKLYHYTPEQKIPDFLESQVIKLAFESLNNINEKAVAWVSSNSHWENTATKNVRGSNGQIRALTFQEQLDFCGCARIQIKPTYKLHKWKELTKLANIKFDVAKGLEKLGKKMGANSNEWYGSLKPIPMSEWVNIEIHKDGKWVEVMNFENDTIRNVESRFFKLNIA